MLVHRLGAGKASLNVSLNVYGCLNKGRMSNTKRKKEEKEEVRDEGKEGKGRRVWG